MRRPNLCRSVRALTLLLSVLWTQAGGAAAPEDLDASLQRATEWLATVSVDPFSDGVESFRRFAVEVECWHRLWALESDGPRRDLFDRETASRLAKAGDPERLKRILSETEGRDALTEMALLASRSGEHGIDPRPFRLALEAHRALLEEEIKRAPPSLRILYASLLPAAGVGSPLPPAEARPGGMLARRPAEIDLTLRDVYHLTHEVFALCDYGLRPLGPLPPEEQAYLLRVLPFFATYYAVGGHLDISGEVLICMVAAGLTDTRAYREGVRTILERQNPDGSFGAPDVAAIGRPLEAGDYLHPTLNGVTVLLLERRLRNR